MELKIYGEHGLTLLAFPCLGGRFYDFEDFGMINVLQNHIENGQVKIVTVDSIDGESWANHQAHPFARAARHNLYDNYIVEEVVPFINNLHQKSNEPIITTGASMGAYHSANFFFRHPDKFKGVIALSGLYHAKNFIGDIMNEDIYFNSPLDYLPNLNNNYYFEKYRQSNIFICVGQGAWEDGMLEDTKKMKQILQSKNIPAVVDIWGHDVDHDWPWWFKQLPYFLDNLLYKLNTN